MKELKPLHIGMRKVKSLLAILIGFIIWQMIRLIFPDLEIHPIFIYMYALLEIRGTSEKTKTLGIQRIKATFVAIAVGMPMLVLRIWLHSQLVNSWAVTALDMVMILVGVLITLQLGQKIGCGDLTGLASVVFIILLVSHADDNRYLYAVLRAFQTVIGVFTAWLLNVILLPYPGRNNEEQKD